MAVDANLRKIPGPVGKVHAGFLTALNQVMGAVSRTIWEYKKDYAAKLAPDSGKSLPSLWFTGHSLGAALATLAVAKMRLENETHEEPIHGLYTFGSPRVGDREFSERFNANFKNQTFRIVNNNDVVTRIPMRVHGYRHIGQFWYITSGGELDDDIDWWNLKLDRAMGWLEDFGKPGVDGVKDHSMTNEYILKLTGIAEK